MRSVAMLSRNGSGIGAAVPWLAGVAIFAVVLFSPAVLNDGDTFSHVASGAWMIAHQAILYTDPFSYTFSGTAWTTHEWLAEVLMAYAFHVGGWSGLVLLTAVAAATALFGLARDLGRWLPPGAVLVLTALAFSCTAPSLLVRPHILALPVLEAWVCGLVIARSRGAAPSWRLLPLMTLWANLHGSFMVGLALIVPLGVEAALAAPESWQQAIRPWAFFLVVAIACAFLTPHGATGLLFPFRLMGMRELANIGEWRPTNFGTLQPLELVLILGLYVSLSRGARLPTVRLLLLLGLLHLALQHTRHQMLAAFIGPLLIAASLGKSLHLGVPAGVTFRWCWAALGLSLAVCLAALRTALPIVRTDGPTAPISALAHVSPSLLAQSVFNDYAFGGYLIYSNVRPFIDARADMYGDPFLRLYGLIIHPDNAALDGTFRRYGVSWTILAPENPAVALLDVLPAWCRLYADQFAVVHVRSLIGPCLKSP